MTNSFPQPVYIDREAYDLSLTYLEHFLLKTPQRCPLTGQYVSTEPAPIKDFIARARQDPNFFIESAQRNATTSE